MNRYEDWLNQGKKDLDAANDSKKSGHYEWTCFQAQQSAEKALKSLLLYLNIDSWGHGLVHHLKKLEKVLEQFQKTKDDEKKLDKIENENEFENADKNDQMDEEGKSQFEIISINKKTFLNLLEMCQELDRHYVQTRYPNGFPNGYPAEFYNNKIAKECIENARNIIKFVKEKIREIPSSE